MKTPTTTILIDDREGSADLLPILIARFPLADVRLARIDSADVAWTGNGPDGPLRCGVELKRTISDWASSVASGRFWGDGGQLSRMLREYDELGLLIAGEPDPRSGWTRQSLESACLSFHAVTGHEARYYPDHDDLLARLEAMIRWWTRPWASHKSQLAIRQPLILHPDLDAGLTPHQRVLVRVLCQIPGVGEDRARSIVAEGFGSLLEVAQSLAAGHKVAGVGPETTKQIIRAVFGPQEGASE